MGTSLYGAMFKFSNLIFTLRLILNTIFVDGFGDILSTAALPVFYQ